MTVTITSIKLKSAFKFFPLSYLALRIIRQLSGTNYLNKDTWGVWTLHFTVTAWNSEQELKDFARSGPHLEAMKQSAKIAEEIRTLTQEMDHFPTRKEARKLLAEQGSVIKF
jgi:hypothetical protein